MGLRHRAAIGITESSNSFAIIISEESGQVSYSKGGEISQNIEMDQMIKILKKTIN
jgi:diadenylate cyclase